MAATCGTWSRACCSLSTTRASPAVHSDTGLVRCRPAAREPELLQQHLDLTGVLRLELDEVEAGRRLCLGEGGEVAPPTLGVQGGGPVLQPEQRPQRVYRGAVGVGLAEGVVEDLERQWAVIAGGQDVGDEGRQVEVALAGEEPMVAAPRQHVHAQGWRVRQLQEEDLVGRNVLDRRRVVAAGQHVEAVQAHADVRVVGALDDAPGAAVVVDEPAPGQGFERHLDVVLPGEVAQPTQLVRRYLVGVDTGGRDIAADQHDADAEPLCRREGGPGAAQVVGEGVLVDALDIAQRLVQVQGQAEPPAERTDLFGAVVVGDEIGLEELHPVEAGRRAGVQLLGERPAQRYRRDGRLHGLNLQDLMYGIVSYITSDAQTHFSQEKFE